MSDWPSPDSGALLAVPENVGYFSHFCMPPLPDPAVVCSHTHTHARTHEYMNTHTHTHIFKDTTTHTQLFKDTHTHTHLKTHTLT